VVKVTTRRRASRRHMESLKKRLLARRSRLARELRAQLGALRRSDRKQLADVTDVATDNLQDLDTLHIAEMEAQELRKIDGAIRRIDAGAFDLCESCGGPIGRDRLQVVPHATLCLRCQEELERVRAPSQCVERWGAVVEAEAEARRTLGPPDQRLDGAGSNG